MCFGGFIKISESTIECEEGDQNQDTEQPRAGQGLEPAPHAAQNTVGRLQTQQTKTEYPLTACPSPFPIWRTTLVLV